MQATELATVPSLDLKVGQLVEIRSAEEILATLDENGEYECLPFMPEMAQYCGQQLRVAAVAHKLCDTQTRSGMRKMNNAVHLTNAHCDGSAHGGCEADCVMYWKEAWLKPVSGRAPVQPAGVPDTARLLPLITVATRRTPGEDGTTTYACQATELLRAAPDPLPLLSMGQYVQDIRTGNVGFFFVLRGFLVGLFNRAQSVSTKVLPRFLWFRGGLHWQFLKGSLDKTPTRESNLQPGELVRVRSKAEILATLNKDLLNRGLGFDPEMARFCGRTVRVSRRVNHIIDEKTGKMLDMKNPCIVLEGVVCEGAYNASCMRAIPAYWREIWLERVPEAG
jgi:hypothetical protein